MSRCLIWFVDDDIQTAQDIITFWESFDSFSPKFRHFSTARAAWQTLLTGTQRPCAIIIDGHLNSDEGELTNGANFVRRLRSFPDLPQPVLLAFSGDEFALEEMESAGAEAGFYKGNVTAVIQYLATLYGNSDFRQ